MMPPSRSKISDIGPEMFVRKVATFVSRVSMPEAMISLCDKEFINDWFGMSESGLA